MPRSTRIVPLAAALTIVLPASAQAVGWTPAVPVPGTAGAGAPQVAAAPAGGATVAWTAGGRVYVTERAADGSFGAPRTVSASGAQGDPVLAVGKGGRAVLAWRREGLVEASVRTAAGAAFDAPQAISGAGAGDLTAAVSGTGTVAVGWVRTSLVQIAERTDAMTSWSGPLQTFTENRPSMPTLAATGDGRLTAVWTAMVEPRPGWASEPFQRSATKPAGGAWTTPVTGARVGLDSMDWAPVTAAGDDTGAVTALWASRTGAGSDGYSQGHPVMTAAVSLAGGAFGTGAAVSDGPTTEGGQVPTPALAVAGSGDAAAAWLVQTKGEEQAVPQVALRAGSAGGWGGPTTLEHAPVADPQSAPDVAVDPQGRPVVVWERLDGTIAGTRSAGGFAPATAISAGGGADAPQVAVDAAGQGVAVWRRGGALESSTYDLTPPPPHDAHDDDPKPSTPGAPGPGTKPPATVGGTTPQPQPARSTTTPRPTQRLTALALTPRTLRAGKAATLSLRLTVPATVKVTIQRRTGRRWTTTGTTTKTAKAPGTLTIKLPRKALRTRGSHRLTLTAIGTTATTRKTFRVK